MSPWNTWSALQTGSLDVWDIVEARLAPVVSRRAAGEAVLGLERRVVLHVVHDVEITHLVVKSHPEKNTKKTSQNNQIEGWV